MCYKNNIEIGKKIFQMKSTQGFEFKRDQFFNGILLNIIGICSSLLGYYLISPQKDIGSLILLFSLYFCGIFSILFGIWFIIDNLRITLPVIYEDCITPEKQKLKYIFKKNKEIIYFKDLIKIFLPSKTSSNLSVTYKNGIKSSIGEYNLEKNKSFCNSLRNQILEYNKKGKNKINIEESQYSVPKFHFSLLQKKNKK